MSTINPDDIAQITLLKGASAAALYGAVAANGAIMVTTKSSQSGKVAINVSSNTTVETPMVLPKFQNSYGVSNQGTFSWATSLLLLLQTMRRIIIILAIRPTTLSRWLVVMIISHLIFLMRMYLLMVLFRRIHI